MTQDVLTQSALTAAKIGGREGCASPRSFARACLRIRSERMPTGLMADEGRVVL